MVHLKPYLPDMPVPNVVSKPVQTKAKPTYRDNDKMIDWLILTTCQPIYGYFMPRG